MYAPRDETAVIGLGRRERIAISSFLDRTGRPDAPDACPGPRGKNRPPIRGVRRKEKDAIPDETRRGARCRWPVRESAFLTSGLCPREL